MSDIRKKLKEVFGDDFELYPKVCEGRAIKSTTLNGKPVITVSLNPSDAQQDWDASNPSNWVSAIPMLYYSDDEKRAIETEEKQTPRCLLLQQSPTMIYYLGLLPDTLGQGTSDIDNVRRNKYFHFF